MIPSGIEPMTFQFVAQHLNHCATAVPKQVMYWGHTTREGRTSLMRNTKEQFKIRIKHVSYTSMCLLVEQSKNWRGYTNWCKILVGRREEDM
jgi:hypothetical protein